MSVLRENQLNSGLSATVIGWTRITPVMAVAFGQGLCLYWLSDTGPDVASSLAVN
ncbi:hypothetical protein GTPT_3241 [Tatumella ptyseos ATCC 33301]|uniref:Uncharacterized protein n=1 Tax=Tatumella ptyseos ATCC 33301 TaxID=1005995 RepID=A0A085J9U0_9GAMM|nr:hypothetical protein GTPT_3241 [Tatumella ptyseos ATCC 33301]